MLRILIVAGLALVGCGKAPAVADATVAADVAVATDAATPVDAVSPVDATAPVDAAAPVDAVSPVDTAPVAPAPPAARVDAFGDALPPGVTLRLGSRRLSDRTGGIEQLAFTPDGTLIAVGRHDALAAATVCVNDVASGAQRWCVRDANVKALVFSADGATLVGATEASIRRWDAKDGLELTPIGITETFALAVNAERLALLTRDAPRLRVLDAQTGALVWTAATKAKGLRFVASELIVAGERITRFDAAGKVVTNVVAADAQIDFSAESNIVIGPGGQVLLPYSLDMLQVFAADGARRVLLESKDKIEIGAVAFSADGALALATVEDSVTHRVPARRFIAWDTTTWARVEAPPWHDHDPYGPAAVAVSLDRVAWGGTVGRVWIADRSGTPTPDVPTFGAVSVGGTAEAPRALADIDGAPHVIDLVSGTKVALAAVPEHARNRDEPLGIDAAGTRVAGIVGPQRDFVAVWSAASGAVEKVFALPAAVPFDPNGSRCRVVGFDDKGIVVVAPSATWVLDAGTGAVLSKADFAERMDCTLAGAGAASTLTLEDRIANTWTAPLQNPRWVASTAGVVAVEDGTLRVAWPDVKVGWHQILVTPGDRFAVRAMPTLIEVRDLAADVAAADKGARAPAEDAVPPTFTLSPWYASLFAQDASLELKEGVRCTVAQRRSWASAVSVLLDCVGGDVASDLMPTALSGAWIATATGVWHRESLPRDEDDAHLIAHVYRPVLPAEPVTKREEGSTEHGTQVDAVVLEGERACATHAWEGDDGQSTTHCFEKERGLVSVSRSVGRGPERTLTR